MEAYHLSVTLRAPHLLFLRPSVILIITIHFFLNLRRRSIAVPSLLRVTYHRFCYNKFNTPDCVVIIGLCQIARHPPCDSLIFFGASQYQRFFPLTVTKGLQALLDHYLSSLKESLLCWCQEGHYSPRRTALLPHLLQTPPVILNFPTPLYSSEWTVFVSKRTLPSIFIWLSWCFSALFGLVSFICTCFHP